MAISNPTTLLQTMPQPQLEIVKQPQQREAVQAFHSAQFNSDVHEQFKHKNRLQEYTQRLGIPLPMYQTKNEGLQHVPSFWSTVVVNGESYTSSNVFLNMKTAEQDAARVALLSLPQKIKDEKKDKENDEEAPLVQEGTTLYKSILNEYAVKIQAEIPFYTTEKYEGLIPVFVSSVVFNGKLYVGEKGRNKKESQQLAARAAILLNLDTDSRPVLFEIIKSKHKIYVALDKLKNASNNQNRGGPSVIQTGSIPIITETKEKESEVVVVNNNLPRTELPEPWAENCTVISASHHLPLHEFGSLKVEPQPPAKVEAITTPVEFVPPASQQLVVGSTSQQLVVGSISSKKRKHRKKNKANKTAKVDAQLHVSSSQPGPCSVSQ